MDTLKRGQIAVDKKHLIAHCNTVHFVLNEMDQLMSQPSTVERGRLVAKLLNQLNTSLHSIEHFELGVPLKKLGNTLLIKK